MKKAIVKKLKQKIDACVTGEIHRIMWGNIRKEGILGALAILRIIIKRIVIKNLSHFFFVLIALIN